MKQTSLTWTTMQHRIQSKTHLETGRAKSKFFWARIKIWKVINNKNTDWMSPYTDSYWKIKRPLEKVSLDLDGFTRFIKSMSKRLLVLLYKKSYNIYSTFEIK